MKRELGPWVWCRYCQYEGGVMDRWFYGVRCSQPTVEQTSHRTAYWIAPTGEVKAGVSTHLRCTPRLTLVGHIRRAIGLPIGEESR